MMLESSSEKQKLNVSMQSIDVLHNSELKEIADENVLLELIKVEKNHENVEKQHNDRVKKDSGRKKKENEKEEKRRKEVEKEQERKKKEEERRKKEEEKRLKQAEKDEERKRKEDEKRLKDAEKEEDKRKKEEERRLKDVEREEDKRKKEEDRKRKEDDKRKEENEKKRQRAIILDFFLRKDKVDQDILEVTRDLQKVGFFKPIELKKDMKLSAVERIKKILVESFTQFKSQSCSFLDEISRNKIVLSTISDTWPISDPDCEVVESSISMRLHAKSFLFNENVRPPFYGTWRKTSRLVNGLNPLVEDISFFDYELDSDQEWEYESGEDISNSEGEEEEEVHDDADDNSFVVPHGYLSDGEECSDVEGDSEIQCSKVDKRSLSPNSRQTIIEIREKQFQAEVKQKVQTINPNIIGPYFIDNDYSKHFLIAMEPYRMICQSNEGLPINCNLQSDFDTSFSSTKIKSVPTEAVPYLVRLLHHNALNRAKICYEFRMFWEFHLTSRLPDVTFEDDLKGKDWDEFTIGKKRLIDTIKKIAERKDGKWIVKPEIIHEYQLCCNDDDPSKPCSEHWKYVSKILTIDSKKKSQKKSLVADHQNTNNVRKEPKPKKRKQLLDSSSNMKEKVIKTVQKSEYSPKHINESKDDPNYLHIKFELNNGMP